MGKGKNLRGWIAAWLILLGLGCNPGETQLPNPDGSNQSLSQNRDDKSNPDNSRTGSLSSAAHPDGSVKEPVASNTPTTEAVNDSPSMPEPPPRSEPPLVDVQESTARPVDDPPDDLQVSETGFPPVDKSFEISAGWTRLGREELWIDRKRHQVIVGGHVCLRAGPLEMFACPHHTKEHESVIAVHTTARFVHAALLAIGAKPGTPVQFEPEYRAATGTTVHVLVRWKQAGQLIEKRGQELVRDLVSREPMRHDWVFVGSGSWTHPETGEKFYEGDSGPLICVSNFGSATLDLPVESSSEAGNLLFEAFTENIPDLGTLVLVILEPEVVGP
jgi:hypothetical protein